MAALESLSEAQMIEPTIDGWSVKDHLAHLAFWDDLRAADIERISAGYESAWHLAESSERLNEIVQGARSGLSIKQVMLEMAAARERVIDAVSAASDRGLDASLYGEASLRSTHDLDHAGYIRNWRSQKGI
jgi:hypothetical protein